MKTIEKYIMFITYIFALYLLIKFQYRDPIAISILFIGFHILFTGYLIRKIRKFEEEKNEHYKEELILKENELQALFDNNNAYLWTIDLENKTFISSTGIENIFGFPREDFKDNYELWLERVIPEDLPLVKEHYERIKLGKPSNQAWRFIDSDGELKWLDAWGTPIFNNGEVTRLTGVAYDITKRKQIEEQLKHSASHDRLTGLPNRTMLETHIDEKLKKDKEPLDYSVLFLDLDNFKVVNDTYGHVVGDQVLVEAAKLIQDIVGENGIVTRHGGDEFVAIVPYNEHAKLSILANIIFDKFEGAFQVDGNYILSLSIGVSTYPKDGDTLQELIAQADKALYQAKSSGKNTIQFANPILNASELRKDQINMDIFKAIHMDQLEVLYQPKVILETKEIYGVEALARWNHPEYGTICPDEFIPIAEAKGVIHEIGIWVIEEVMKQLLQWESKGINLTCSFNVSNIQFESYCFLENIEQMLMVYEVNPEQLVVEITESFMQTANSRRSIKKLKELGLEVSIDDFGTGYSALSTLTNELVDEIKIDKSFIRGLTGNNPKLQIAKIILKLSETFSARTVAEGIETEEETTILQQMGCIYGQGFLYSPPVKAEIIEEMVLN